MAEQMPKENGTPEEAYDPADEYTPLDMLFDTERESVQKTSTPELNTDDKSGIPAAPKPLAEPGAPAEPVAPSAHTAPAQPAAEHGVPQPAQGFTYPGAPAYPYPAYTGQYIQPPVQNAQPYYPPYPTPGQMPYPQQNAMPPYPPQSAMPPYPGAQSYAYPPQQAPQPMQQPVYPPMPQPVPVASEPKQTNKRADKPATSTGTKVFLIALSAIMLAMIAGFTIYVATVASKDKGTSTPSDTGNDPFSEILKPDSDINIDPFDTPSSNKITEFDTEITLLEDKGETQKREDDNEESVGTPDAGAKGIELAALPKDKDDAKYTAQSTYEKVCDSVVVVEIFEGKLSDNKADIVGAGTGTIISADGYLITNAHVIMNSKHYAVKIITNSGKSYQAKIIGYDTWTDLAVLKIDAEGLTPVTFGDSDLIEIGQDVLAIGSPGGEKYQNSLTKGVISAINREISVNKYVRYIQSDAAISPGNSGGPLCNMYGQVIGINTAKTIATNYEAMTFSIPSADVQKAVNELIRYGYVRGRTRIGFAGTEVSSEQMQYYGVPAGLVVTMIDPTGALAGTDIKVNDIITAVNGEKVSSFQDVYLILDKHKPGDKLTLSVYRVEE